MKTIEKSVLINADVAKTFAAYRQFLSLPERMDNVNEIELEANNIMTWHVKGPLGLPLEWQAKLEDVRHNELISWSPVETSGIQTSGQIAFAEVTNLQTRLTAVVNYEGPGHGIADGFVELLKNPEDLLEQSLQDFKHHVEKQPVIM